MRSAFQATAYPRPSTGQRTHRLEPARAVAQLRIGAVLPRGDRFVERAAPGHEPRPEAREPPAEIERLELTPHLLKPPLARRERRAHHARQRMRELRGVASSHRDAAPIAGERRSPAQHVDAAAQPLHASARRGAQPILEPVDAAAELILS